MCILGIDLGTTNSLACAFRNGKAELIPNAFGEYMTPSVVAFDGDEVIVGKIAKEKLISDPNCGVALFKRKMGSNHIYTIQRRKYTPSQLSALVVKQLIQDAEHYLQEKVEEIVVSVPAYFDAKQRKATKQIGELLGIKLERLLNEPSAASIAVHEEGSCEAFVVFDFGGGTLDVSVVDCFENVVSIASIAGNNHLGGRDFDEVIASYFCQQNTIDFHKCSLQQQRSILRAAEVAKQQLTYQKSVEMKVNLKNKNYSCTLDESLLKELSGAILLEMKRVIGKAVQHSGFKASELDSFVLAGGSSRMPLVQHYLQNLINLPIQNEKDMDELIAIGLGKYVGMMQRSEQMKDLIISDICPFTLATNIINRQDVNNPLSRVVIPRNTALPASKTIVLQTAYKGQKEINFGIFQGEAMYSNDNLYLGQINLKIPENQEEHEQFSLTYSYDINSMLFVEVHIHSTNEHYTYQLGDDTKLVQTQNQKAMEQIKHISLKISQDAKVEVLLARAQRIFVECDERNKEHLRSSIQKFLMDMNQTTSQLHKKRQNIEAFEAYLNRMEVMISIDDLDIFSFDEDEEDEMQEPLGGFFS